MRRWLAVVVIALLALPLIAQDTPPIQQYVVKVLNTYPHDPAAFTQGLLYYEGKLYESTGRERESTLREVDPTTGEVLRSIPVLRTEAELAEGKGEYFAEGLERVGDELIQLTWHAEEAFVYDVGSFERKETLNYEGQGWGLCSDERYLYMSDGSNYLTLRDLDTFEPIIRFLVTFNDAPVQRGLMNELECVADSIYANMWQTDYIVEIDKADGRIIGLIDASDLLTDEERAQLDSNQVLNGIAYNPDSGTFFITGKQWPKLFEVEFVPAPEETDDNAQG